MKLKTLTNLILLTSCSAAYSMGLPTGYSFYLDTSLQKSFIEIDPPQFKSDPQHNFPGAIKCEALLPSSTIPIFITGMGRGLYSCSATSALDLKHNSMYDLTGIINIKMNDQIIKINVPYRFDPWEVDHTEYTFTFLLYLNNENKLSYRSI